MQATQKTALLVVDVQQALIESRPAKGGQLLCTIGALLRSFRKAGRPVLFVRHEDGPGTPLAYGAPGWQIARAAAPIQGERVFDKKYNSAFLHTGLGPYLRRQGVTTLVIVGMQTEYCIDATIKSAFEQGFQVVLPIGGITTFRNGGLPARKINRLFYRHIWQGRYGRVLPAGEIIKEISL